MSRVIVGREDECGRVEELLEIASGGHSAALLLRGDAGIGKTALCDFAVSRAAPGLVLRARGVPAEAELAFAGLADLLRPVLGGLDAIPAPQALALAGALAIGPPTQGDRFTVCAATLSLLAAHAEERPLLVVVDDAHWLDPSSTEALLFASRRLDAEGVALLATVRTGEQSAFDRAGLPVLELLGLDAHAAAELLARGAGFAPDPAVAERLHLATAGNPLALHELAVVLDDAVLRGEQPLPDPLPFGPSLDRVFVQRVDDLPDDVRRALVVAAAGDGGSVETVLAGLRELGVDEDALMRAEGLGLVELREERLTFAHPLLRAAAYRSATTLERRAAHRALTVSPTGAVPVERRAIHLAAATASPDEDVAAQLEESARRARARGGHAEAARGFLEAARLSVEPELRASRLREAANDFRVVGELEEAFAALDEALAATSDDLLRAEIQHIRGRAEMWRGAASAGYELLVREAAAVEGLDAERAAVMLIDAAMLALESGDTERALRAAQRSCEIAPDDGGALTLLCRAARDTTHVLRGERTDEDSFAVLVEALEGAGEAADLPAHQLVVFAGWALIWSEEYDRARNVLGRIAEHGRAQSAPGQLPLVLAALSDLDFRSGRWSSAFAGAAEGVRLAGETRQLGALPYALVSLARVEAAQGREDECRAHAANALQVAADIGAGSITLLARSALGLLELGLARPEAAVEELEHVARAETARGVGDPGAVQWAPDLIEACVRLGRTAEAEAALERLQERADATGRSWALAAVLRCRGLVVTDHDEAESAFREALEAHDALPAPFERARTELAFGERLRRARRRADAREWLRSALATFERLGALPWSNRTRTELQASGETLGRRDEMPLHELTPQELQVALLVAQGATNREAGAALFLSPKTIEAHLGRVYRKLAVRSRTQLAHVIATEAAAVEAA